MFLRASVLSLGLVLVDLPGEYSNCTLNKLVGRRVGLPGEISSDYGRACPGLRDLNSARRNVTERYLIDQCDEIFAVCRIERATTDQGLADVFKLSKQSRPLNVSIVCTRSEVQSYDFR